MEEANQQSHSYSKKRKEPCALENPLSGIFTRSRSQIYLHCNRSGRSRSDSSLHGTQYSDLFRLLTLSKKPKRIYRSSFKDLRTSGVLYPGQENEDAKVFKEDIEGLGDGFSSSAVDLQPKTPDSARYDKDASIGKVIDDLPAFEGIEQVESERPDNMEFGETATPPDTEFLSNKLEFISQDKSNSQNDVRIEEGFGGSDDRQNGSNLPGKSVLTRCFPGKLFKTPGSFSYRRLLPYLMDISEDKSCVKKIDQSLNIESGRERKLVQPVSTSQSQGIKVKSTTENSPREGCADDSTNDLSERDKTFGNAGRDKINSRAPYEIRVSHNSSIDFPTALNSTNLEDCEVINAKSDHNKLIENQKTEQHDNHIACKTQNLNHVDGNQSSRDRDLGDYFDDQKQSEEARIMKKCKSHHDGRAPNQCHPLSNAQGDNKLRGDSDYYVLDQIEGSSEECLHTTPPDDDIFLQTESCNHNFESPLTRTIHCRYGSVHDSRINASSKRKMMNMFEIRSSFSYKRLLPFLTNIIEDESGACRDGIKAEKILKQKSLPTFSASNSDEIIVKGFNDASIIRIPRLSDVFCSSINDQPALSFPEKEVKSSVTVDSQGKQKLQVEDTTSIANKKLETASSKADVAHGCGIPSIKRCSVSTEESISKNAINLVLNQSSLSSEIGSKKCITKYTSAGKGVKFSSISQNFLQIGACVPLRVASPSPPPFKKGILKRNPRGCRGICTCLSCAAFRLHARKAFEFSRNQMQDAEELALDLIRELTQLRTVLEKSASNTDSSSAASANQVNEARRKASEVEKLAMNRLSQMNYELNIHCRIPCEKRPRVRFANQVEEQSFAKSDFDQ